MRFELITVRYSGKVLTYLGFRKSVHGPLSKVYTKPTDKHKYVLHCSFILPPSTYQTRHSF